MTPRQGYWPQDWNAMVQEAKRLILAGWNPTVAQDRVLMQKYPEGYGSQDTLAFELDRLFMGLMYERCAFNAAGEAMMQVVKEDQGKDLAHAARLKKLRLEGNPEEWATPKAERDAKKAVPKVGKTARSEPVEEVLE